jgi:hypothetical protein
MKETCPYTKLPPTAFWKMSISSQNYTAVDPIWKPKFQISTTSKVATAGSCFASHLAKALVNNGFNHFITERAPAWMDPNTQRSMGYGQFSARYGNVYTAVQLLQLFQRAFGEFFPIEDFWQDENSWYDPFRPSIQRGGFASIDRAKKDREIHLAAVRRMFEELDYFVFTLGLTETWRSKKDGAVFPQCPGCPRGHFDPRFYEFVNLNVEETVAALGSFLKKLRSVNQNAKVLLTVSPVGLAATFTDSHVLTASTYSKSVLRVAAEAIKNNYENVDYFPSFEIVTNARDSGYFDPLLRDVTSKAVGHVIRIFITRLTNSVYKEIESEAASADPPVVCDEEMLNLALSNEAFGTRGE